MSVELQDPLDRIEAAVVRWCSDPATPDNAIPASPDEVLALVAVARAARDLTTWTRFVEPALHRLDEALAGPDTPADHNEEGHAKRPSGDPACDGGSVRAGSVVRPVDGGGGRPDRGRAARSVWQTLGDTPADSQPEETT